MAKSTDPAAEAPPSPELATALANQERARKQLESADAAVAGLSPEQRAELAGYQKDADAADAALASARAAFDKVNADAAKSITKAQSDLDKAQAAADAAHAKLAGGTADVTATVYRDASGLWAVAVQATHPDETIISFNGRGVFKG